MRRVERIAARGSRRVAGDGHVAGFAAAEIEDHPRRELDADGCERRIDAALEAVTRVGIDAELASRPRGPLGVEPGGFDEDVDRLRRASGAHPADDAADGLGALLVADQRFAAVEGVGLAVERRQPLAGTGEADGDRAVQLVGIEDMQRPVAVVGNEIGDVDQRRDRPEADGAEPVLQPLRRGAVPDAADQAADEERAGLAGNVGGEIDADRAGFDSCDGLHFGRAQLAEAARGEIAGDAGHAEGVGPVGRDGDVDDRIDADHVDVARADRRVGGEFDDAVMGIGKLHLALGEHHAVALDTADPADLDRGVDAGDPVAGGRDHHLDAGAGVRGAADDLLLAVGGQNPADPELVGVGVLHGLDHLADREGREPSGRVRHALDLEPEVGQREGDLVERRRGVEMLLEPGEREFHRSVPSEVGRGGSTGSRTGTKGRFAAAPDSGRPGCVRGRTGCKTLELFVKSVNVQIRPCNPNGPSA